MTLSKEKEEGAEEGKRRMAEGRCSSNETQDTRAGIPGRVRGGYQSSSRGVVKVHGVYLQGRPLYSRFLSA